MYLSVLINTYEKGMFDVVEVTNLNTGLRYEHLRDEKEAIRYLNELGYYICAARTGQVFMTKKNDEE